jgi:GxxExxY protein
LESGFKIDVLVQRLLVLELKAVVKILPVHEAQLLTYLRLGGFGIGSGGGLLDVGCWRGLASGQ